MNLSHFCVRDFQVVAHCHRWDNHLCSTAHKKKRYFADFVHKSTTAGSTFTFVFFLYNTTSRHSAITPATPLFRKCTTQRWTLWCSHHSVAKRQQFSCRLKTATLSLKFPNVFPAGWICFFPVPYPRNNFTAARAGASTSRGNFFFFFQFRVRAARYQRMVLYDM